MARRRSGLRPTCRRTWWSDMDVMMPKKDGEWNACREIMESALETRVLMLTASMAEDAIVEAVAAGATGYLQKDTDREQLKLSAVRNVALGNLRLPPEMVRRAFTAIRGAGKGDFPVTRSERHLRHPAKVEGRDDAGTA